jgi:hypothetical protein
MRLKETQKALNTFGKRVVKQAKQNLTKGKKNVNNKLYNSIFYKAKVMPNSIDVFFFMEEYGIYQDRGVKGTKSNYIENRDTPFSYRTDKPPVEPLIQWAKKRNFRLRDDKGKFAKGSYKTIGFILQKSIFNKGIRASMFFTTPFENEFKKLPADVIEQYGLDIDQFLELTT